MFKLFRNLQIYQIKFDADFALMTGELARLIPALVEALGGISQ